jgi:hypothetical protein
MTTALEKWLGHFVTLRATKQQLFATLVSKEQ